MWVVLIYLDPLSSPVGSREVLANKLSPMVHDTPPVPYNVMVLGKNMSPVLPPTWKPHGVAMPQRNMEGDYLKP
jgi:hypothetical protein